MCVLCVWERWKISHFDFLPKNHLRIKNFMFLRLAPSWAYLHTRLILPSCWAGPCSPQLIVESMLKIQSGNFQSVMLLDVARLALADSGPEDAWSSLDASAVEGGIIKGPSLQKLLGNSGSQMEMPVSSEGPQGGSWCFTSGHCCPRSEASRAFLGVLCYSGILISCFQFNNQKLKHVSIIKTKFFFCTDTEIFIESDFWMIFLNSSSSSPR